MIAQHAHPRHSHAVRLLDRLLERGRLLDAQSHIQAHEYQQRTGEKRNAPAEIEELRVAQCFRQQQEHAAGADEAERRAQLGEHAVPGALARWCVLGGEQYRAAPFTAKRSEEHKSELQSLMRHTSAVFFFEKKTTN